MEKYTPESYAVYCILNGIEKDEKEYRERH